MATRQKKENWIAQNDVRGRQSLMNMALANIMTDEGLSFFTDDQIDRIVSEMVGDIHSSHRRMISNRPFEQAAHIPGPSFIPATGVNPNPSHAARMESRSASV
ncbi:hypothetical protein IFT84_17645 [Rhizobium sp. CFBP 8762]|uniref:hypothetical protein n=1 Tax=Rhizobium sp. CFBP 8762 TaxID=2775279 RepID=UPI00178516EE|nr:hypothetical protein [Rhizobium sp. CFBP 8762]MBD8556335.1 hypothetical protein [Rhizobium sp. CFBP 8762]